MIIRNQYGPWDSQFRVSKRPYRVGTLIWASRLYDCCGSRDNKKEATTNCNHVNWPVLYLWSKGVLKCASNSEKDKTDCAKNESPNPPLELVVHIRNMLSEK